ncbi:fibronectin type III domain-containing protein [Flagellimonas lutimaris]|uniref:fibronectin type III domain-containing protein n=1 Tax=Flagellimonas lutimaris TaxID=475082 RepID=UPI003F5CCE1A
MDFKKAFGLVVFILFVFFGWSQDETLDSIQSPKLVVKGFAKKDAIYLRWGVDDKWAWKYGNEYGYRVERVTIFREGSPLETPERVLLTTDPIKPKPLLEWEPLIKTNDMAAVAAQAIYGESFSVNDESENLFMKVVNQSSELEQRFGFSMFAVDQDFVAAQYAGLGYVDEEVKQGERYLYNIKPATPQEILKIDESGILIAPTIEQSLPKPYDFAGYYYNNAFVLIWEYDGLLDFYTAYDLEKSEDGKIFSKVNDAPITKLAITKSSGISFTDSIPVYGKKYWYRVKGRTLFNETGPHSDTTSVIAFKELLAIPQFTTNNILSEKEVALQWGFPKDEAWKLTGFDVLRAPKAIGPYKEVATALDKQTRSFQYNGLETINYFKVRAHGIAGDHQDSSPAMIQPVDSIPPDKPVGLQGKVDTLGVVRLSWDPNTEMDLKGYTVLRADRDNQEFTRLTRKEMSETNFQDSINIKNFASKVYYRIIASDLRYNESQPSDTLVLQRPSRVPPTSPVFTEYELLDDTILLKWTRSSSDKLVKQIIYRKDPRSDNGLWENVYETEDVSITAFKDVKTEPNTTYSYTITAMNTAGLESKPSPVVSVATPQVLLKPKIKGFYAQVDRESKNITLTWRYNQPKVLEIHLYKKENESNYSIYKTFKPSTGQFVDTKLIPNSNYGYGIKAVFTDGSTSQWEELDIKY